MPVGGAAGSRRWLFCQITQIYDGHAENAYDLLDDLPEATLAAACWFCWGDEVGAPGERGPRAFGLRREQEAGGTTRPAWSACRRLAAE